VKAKTAKTMKKADLQKLEDEAQGVYVIPTGSLDKQTKEKTKELIELMKEGKFDKVNARRKKF
jgi:Spy/CpxP family protein refolding chaperone